MKWPRTTLNVFEWSDHNASLTHIRLRLHLYFEVSTNDHINQDVTSIPLVNRALAAQVWSLKSEQILDNYLPCESTETLSLFHADQQHWHIPCQPAACHCLLPCTETSHLHWKLRAFQNLITYKLDEIKLHLCPSAHPRFHKLCNWFLGCRKKKKTREHYTAYLIQSGFTFPVHMPGTQTLTLAMWSHSLIPRQHKQVYLDNIKRYLFFS